MPAIALSVAPMMELTDRHCRSFLRLLSKNTLLYTEMVTTGAVLHGDRERLLGYDAAEHPVALQLGGSDPAELAACARIAEEWGYDEVNLNVGCPSDRVQSGRFGACLIAEPDLVARLVGAMREAVSIPVTVKSRIAIDEMEEWPTLDHFVRTVSAAGCTHFIVHARKAWLKGLSPKENRDIPPLRYDLVHRLKQENPRLTIAINGGIRTLDEAAEHLATLDSVMIGRAAYETPYILADADRRLFGGEPGPDRYAVVEAMAAYAEERMRQGAPLSAITRHMLGLFQGLPGARAWRRHISENAHLPGAGPEVLLRAAALVPHREAVTQPAE
ncbi:tRNA dihydrouridine(20/20a) synthase DusA [Azospirillum brasilense]|uniref:tRNA dihydrouridine(20/20a) synthase DusA n=1 Tax=Azospirillum brasilense TaxID=192 RepID=UPI00190C6013|nr:tRNA dihydrouridine(20/20a) synthase DusA [Azospirillum brasilense]MBK3732686.1 tRNA dihydrouridine(20/20a) synthase DusA [Azospirillum brasilense]